MNNLVKNAEKKAKDLYGITDMYDEVCNRIIAETEVVDRYYTLYSLVYLLTEWSKKENVVIFVDIILGNSLVAYLNGMTGINPLVPHYYCHNCDYCERLPLI